MNFYRLDNFYYANENDLEVLLCCFLGKFYQNKQKKEKNKKEAKQVVTKQENA